MVQKTTSGEEEGTQGDNKKVRRSPMWTPSQELVDNCEMAKFIFAVQERFHDAQVLKGDYESLWQWSVSHPSDFWGFLWEYLDIKHSAPYTSVVENLKNIEKAKFFPGAKLNF